MNTAPGRLLDTHCHLLFAQLTYPWQSEIPALAGGTFGLSERGGGQILFMESGATNYKAEARLVAGLVRQGLLLGQVAACRPEDDDFDSWLDECSTLGVKGVRRVLHVEPDGLCAVTGFRRNIKRLGTIGLPFDLCVQARQLDLAADLAQDCEGVTFVLDHCGLPDIAGGAFDPWAKGLARIASCPNVICKFSGFAGYCGPRNANAATLRPWADHVLRCFGADRIMWGSDWPLVNISLPLDGWTALTAKLLAGLSQFEQAQIGHLTARRVYRLT